MHPPHACPHAASGASDMRTERVDEAVGSPRPRRVTHPFVSVTPSKRHHLTLGAFPLRLKRVEDVPAGLTTRQFSWEQPFTARLLTRRDVFICH
eukprot:5980849-Prymnesium_polylepis.2